MNSSGITEIKNWVCLNYTTPFKVTEFKDLKITGFVFDDPRFPDGEFIITSRIISVNCRSVITESGSHYWLAGNPEETWWKYCISSGWNLDPEEPFKNIKILISNRE